MKAKPIWDKARPKDVGKPKKLSPALSSPHIPLQRCGDAGFPNDITPSNSLSLKQPNDQLEGTALCA